MTVSHAATHSGRTASYQYGFSARNGLTDSGDAGANADLAIHQFCTTYEICDFVLFTPGRDIVRAKAHTFLRYSDHLCSNGANNVQFLDWKVFRRFENTFTPASFHYAEDCLKIVAYGETNEVSEHLDDAFEIAFFESLKAKSGFCVPLVSNKGDRALALMATNGIGNIGALASLYFKLLNIFNMIQLRQRISQSKDSSKLTSREVECLKWVADGKTSLEIAAITNLSVHTINHYMKICCNKLNTVNRIQAAVVAARQNII